MLREQLAEHEERAARLEEELAALRHARDHAHAAHAPHSRLKEHYLVHEVTYSPTALHSLVVYPNNVVSCVGQIKRYRTYAYVMRARGGGAGADEAAPAVPERAAPA
ncbi:hypothetical protein HF086_016624 [Spodoptera exigua]|uniref:Uncharacterized protein n=1 Tax=Spodoptera exigua TaxID=7107 RepID=A0A922MDE5_SPOEX|nr:hypothetical protein HF086_016624 [Spodoptera exigua]